MRNKDGENFDLKKKFIKKGLTTIDGESILLREVFFRSLIHNNSCWVYIGFCEPGINEMPSAPDFYLIDLLKSPKAHALSKIIKIGEGEAGIFVDLKLLFLNFYIFDKAIYGALKVLSKRIPNTSIIYTFDFWHPNKKWQSQNYEAMGVSRPDYIYRFGHNNGTSFNLWSLDKKESYRFSTPFDIYNRSYNDMYKSFSIYPLVLDNSYDNDVCFDPYFWGQYDKKSEDLTWKSPYHKGLSYLDFFKVSEGVATLRQQYRGPINIKIDRGKNNENK